MISSKKKTKELVKQYNLLEEYKKYSRLAKKQKTIIHIYEDWQEGYPENKFFTAELYKPFPEGLIYMCSRKTVDELLDAVREYLEG